VRFTNEADSYHDFVQAMQRLTPPGEACRAFLIADHRAIRRYGMGFVKPGPFPLAPHLRSGYLVRGEDAEALAARLGLPRGALSATLARFNEHAVRGEDPDFGRGRSAYNRYLGDPSHAPNPCLAPLSHPTFYALELRPGDLGTFAGLKGDVAARVLDRTGAPIPGLFAAGNDLASIMGGNYPGGGITLGPAMTFGYIAAHHLARAA
jgi:succinate dehydrogenase/fumarate reductase flavoprotein subunit